MKLKKNCLSLSLVVDTSVSHFPDVNNVFLLILFDNEDVDYDDDEGEDDDDEGEDDDEN